MTRKTGYYVIAIRDDNAYKLLLGPFDSATDAIKRQGDVTLPAGSHVAVRRLSTRRTVP